MGQIESKANAGKAAKKATASTSVDALTAYKNSNAYKRQVAARKAFENNVKKNPPKDLTFGDGSALNVCLFASDDAEEIDCKYVISNFLTSPTGCGDPEYRKKQPFACKVADGPRAPAKTRADFEAMQRCYADPKKPECARWGCDPDGNNSNFGCPGYSPAHGQVLYPSGIRGPFKIPTTNWSDTRNLSNLSC